MAKRKPKPSELPADVGAALYRKVVEEAEHLRTYDRLYPASLSEPIQRATYCAAVADLLDAWDALNAHLAAGGNRPHAWDASTPEVLPLLQGALRVQVQDASTTAGHGDDLDKRDADR
jgi:hypothetical protein